MNDRTTAVEQAQQTLTEARAAHADQHSYMLGQSMATIAGLLRLLRHPAGDLAVSTTFPDRMVPVTVHPMSGQVVIGPDAGEQYRISADMASAVAGADMVEEFAAFGQAVRDAAGLDDELSPDERDMADWATGHYYRQLEREGVEVPARAFTPTAARELAARLIEAADAAERTDRYNRQLAERGAA